MNTQTTTATRPFGPKPDPIPVFKVGDGATRHLYTDSQAGTIIAVSNNGRQVTWQRDTATRKPGQKLEQVVGGFCAHTLNSHKLEYDYTPNPQGQILVFSLRRNGRWMLVGDSMHDGDRLTAGRKEFYDHNF